MSAPRKRIPRRKPLTLASRNESEKGIGDVVGGDIVKRSAGPFDAGSSWRPDAKERSIMWLGEPPPFNEAWHRRVYDMNKQLADDLCGGIAVEGSSIITNPTPYNRKRGKKHRS
jgi:hypothetical protein